MLISKNWLEKFVNLDDLESHEIAKALTMKTVEVEDVKESGKFLDGVVVGEILDIKKHPNADKLSIAQVNVGEEKNRQIIFGQMLEMEVGYRVPVALAPTVLPGDKEIKKTKMRGETSEGMLCLDQELGLLDEGVSIQFFEKDVNPGTPIIEALKLKDVIFEVDNKSLSNRPDLWGHYGIAREVAAIFERKLKKYETIKIKSGKDENLNIKVEDEKLCTRYMGVVVDGIKIEPSPDWLQQSLIAIGQRPINNIVDITNYVMFELGQPTHAFDFAKLARNKKQETNIIIRKAKKSEKFKTLDDVDRKLGEDMLVIADEEKALAIAGVMGGQNSEVNENTTKVIFESANFLASSIRTTSTKLGLRTEGSARWEKSLDPNNAEIGLKRLLELTLQICPGAQVVSNVVDESNFSLNQGPIEISLEFINQRIGKEVNKVEVLGILQRLGFGVKEKKGKLKVIVPSWRATRDISIAEDLVEEILRIHGYEQVSGIMPNMPMASPESNELRGLERKLKEFLSYQFGYDEVYNYSFVAREWLEKLGEETKNHLELDNPIAKDRTLLRRHLVDNMLLNIEDSLHRFDEAKIYEIGKVYTKEEKGELAFVSSAADDGVVKKDSSKHLPKQNTLFAMMYSQKGDENPFAEAASDFVGVMERLGLPVDFKKSEGSHFVHPGRFAEIYIKGVKIGLIGELGTVLQKKIGIPYRVAMLEVNLNNVLPLLFAESNYQALPSYPSAERDIAIVVDTDAEHMDIKNALQTLDPLLASVELFDVYQGDKMESGKKSMAYHLTYRAPDRTLSAEEVDQVQQRVIKTLEKKFGAQIRE